MYKVGVVGLGVMGANLARNIASRGVAVAGYDLDAAKTHAFAAGQSKDSTIGSADAPDRLMATVAAAVDAVRIGVKSGAVLADNDVEPEPARYRFPRLARAAVDTNRSFMLRPQLTAEVRAQGIDRHHAGRAPGAR